MPMKAWIHRFQPVQLYIVLLLSICYFIVQLILSHITHALTLLVDSYHMLCNIVALSGCILTIKHSKRKLSCEKDEKLPKEEECIVENSPTVPHDHRALKLRNTFGWTRIDVLTMLICCIFLASLSFSLFVEALQTLVHIEHEDTMHLPIPILILGAAGLVLNLICYVLIGGYTMHQGSFLQLTSTGEVVLDQEAANNKLKPAERRLSKTKREHNQVSGNQIERHGNRQGFMEMFRDISSTLFVIVCAIIVYFSNDEEVAKFADPIISICSCSILLFLSYPYMKESCLILLQTIPGTIDIEIFKKTLLSRFHEIVNVHDLHIWQLTANKSVSTVHIIFQNPTVYTNIMEDVKNFFHQQGITIVTIQPEFKSTHVPLAEECLVQCQDATCAQKHCCQRFVSNLQEIVLHEDKKQNDKTKSLNLSNGLTFNYAEKAKSTNNLCEPEQNGQLKKFCSDSRIDKDKDEASLKSEIVEPQTEDTDKTESNSASGCKEGVAPTQTEDTNKTDTNKVCKEDVAPTQTEDTSNLEHVSGEISSLPKV